MDAISFLGFASANIALSIAQTIQGLSTLRGKFKDADLSIRLMIGELSTIRAGVSQVQDWAQWNSQDSPKEAEYLEGLKVALDGCQAAVEALAEEIKYIVAGIANDGDQGIFIVGFKVRAKVIWSEDTMKNHRDRMHAQVQALQLLLQAAQCRSSTAQLDLLRLKENRRIIQKVVEDTRSLRESMSTTSSQAAFSIEDYHQSTAAVGTHFDLGQRLQETDPYPTTINGDFFNSDASQNTEELEDIQQRPTLCNTSFTEPNGTRTGARSTPPAPLSRNQSSKSVDSVMHRSILGQTSPESNDVYRSRSLSSSYSQSSSQSDPAIRRNFSSSSASSSSSLQTGKFSLIRKKSIWPNLSRLKTFSKSSIREPISTVPIASPISSARNRGLRGQETNLNQSIDFGTSDGLGTPQLVRAAQAGSRVEVERLIDNRHDIEAFHGSTRRTALAVAAHCGNFEVVETLIQLNAKVGCRDYTSSTPLHLAASRGHIGVMELLLNTGTPLEETDDKNATALWIAADRGHIDAVELLLRKGAKVNTRAANQLTPLHAAAQRGDIEISQLLLRHRADVEARDSQFMAALHYACENGHDAVVNVLLGNKAHIETLGAEGKAPFLCAAAGGHYHIVELLLQKRALIRSKDNRENNALHWAVYRGHVDIADLLLQKKLPINERNADGLTPLHIAVIGCQFSAVEFLLRKNAVLESRCHKGRTPMHYACGSENPDIVRLLLSAGAQAEAAVTGDQRRPIHIAASSGSVGIVQLLCEKGVSIDARDSAGDRPLCLACLYGHVEVAKKLLDFNAALHLPFGGQSYEDSALSVAAKEGHLAVVSLLVQKGASVRQKDEMGWPPIRYAAHYGHPEVLELLLSEAATLAGDAPGASGLDANAEYMDFDITSNISEERKRRVRELIFQADDHLNNYMAERGMWSDSPTPDPESQTAELPSKNLGMTTYIHEMAASMVPNLVSRESRKRLPRRTKPTPPPAPKLPSYLPAVYHPIHSQPLQYPAYQSNDESVLLGVNTASFIQGPGAEEFSAVPSPRLTRVAPIASAYFPTPLSSSTPSGYRSYTPLGSRKPPASMVSGLSLEGTPWPTEARKSEIEEFQRTLASINEVFTREEPVEMP